MYIAKLKLSVTELDVAETFLPPCLGLQLVKHAVRGLNSKALQATLANFESKPLADQNMIEFLDVFGRVSDECREQRGKRQKLALAAKATNKAAKKREKEE